MFNGTLIAESTRAVRVLETAGAPVYYVPRDDVRMEHLQPTSHRTVCEWKGIADYFDVTAGGRRARRAAFTYAKPTPGYETIAEMISFYPQEVEAFLDDERVRAQPGGFYAGWVTSDIVGPFKGSAGTAGW